MGYLITESNYSLHKYWEKQTKGYPSKDEVDFWDSLTDEEKQKLINDMHEYFKENI